MLSEQGQIAKPNYDFRFSVGFLSKKSGGGN